MTRRIRFITLSTALLVVPAAASAAIQKEVEECSTVKEAGRRLECYDTLARRVGNDKTAAQECTEEQSVLSRLGGGLFRSFPRQRELW